MPVIANISLTEKILVSKVDPQAEIFCQTDIDHYNFS
jgi:hypothetical protein